MLLLRSSLTLRYNTLSTARSSKQWIVRASQGQAAATPPKPAVQQTKMSFAGPGSEKLRQQSCGGACSRDTPKVSDEQLAEYLRDALPSWSLSADRTRITRKFVAKNFVAAVNFFNAVCKVAEEEGHHPDLHLTNFREVEVNVYTHAVGGITMPDLVLAAKLDAIDVDYSPKWLKQVTEEQGKAAQH